MLAAVVVVVATGLVAASCSSGPDDGVGTSTTTRDAAASSTPGDATDEDVAEGGVALERLDVDLDQPIAAVAAPSGNALLVAERTGRVVEVTLDDDGAVSGVEPVIDISEAVADTSGERGLLGIAVDPDAGQLLLSYTRGSDGASQLDAYQLDPDATATVVDESTRRNLLDVEQPFANHNGGHVALGPDAMVYLGLGDGGGQGDPDGRAQDRSSLLGKLLRFDVSAPDGVPADNPFVDTEGAQAEIWATGVRNPWRFSFDRETGDLWVADVGQNEIEEITVLRAADGAGRGANLGWDLFEGDAEFDDADPAPGDASEGPFADPVFTYTHDQGCSITGGVVYRGEQIPSLRGRYLFSDFCTPGLRSLPATAPDGPDTALGLELPSVVGFAEDAGGEVYVISLDEGLHRLVPSA
jgi:glucose/arabinose dehydrogenase